MIPKAENRKITVAAVAVTIQQYNNTTIQQYNNTTIQQYNNYTARQQDNKIARERKIIIKEQESSSQSQQHHNQFTCCNNHQFYFTFHIITKEKRTILLDLFPLSNRHSSYSHRAVSARFSSRYHVHYHVPQQNKHPTSVMLDQEVSSWEMLDP